MTLQNMIYDFYFHNDFDGWASAAVMLSFLENRGDRIGHFVPVDHDLQSQWIDDHFFAKHRLFKGKRHAPIVLDFPFHPGTAFWFDHHPTAFKKEEWKEKFHEDLSHIYRPRYFSCCHLTYATLKRNFNWHPPEYLKELTVWLDSIDGARYASPTEPLLMKEPAFAIDSFVDAQKRDSENAEWLVRLLASSPLDDVAKSPRIAAAGRRARQDTAQNLAFYRKHLVRNGDVTVINLIGHEKKFLRYAPYYLFPKIRYGVRTRRKGALYGVGVGENPWLPHKGKIHLGRLVGKYGGGGHSSAAAVDFKTKEEAECAKEEIIERLNSAPFPSRIGIRRELHRESKIL
jgi:hypothetical protein